MRSSSCDIDWHSYTSPALQLLPDFHCIPNLLRYPIPLSLPFTYNTIFLFHASPSCKTYLSYSIVCIFYLCHPHLHSQDRFLLSCFLAPPNKSHRYPAHQHALEPSLHQEPGSLEAATLAVLPLERLSQEVRAKEQVLSSAWWQPTTLWAGWSQLPKCYADLLWTMLPPWAWAIKYSVSHTSSFVKQLEEVIQHDLCNMEQSEELWQC